MSIISGLLNNTITSINSVTRNAYGDTTRTIVYSDVPCRWVESIGRVVGVNNIEKEYRVECWLSGDYTISEDYEIIYNSEIYRIVIIERPKNLSGSVDHIKLYLA